MQNKSPIRRFRHSKQLTISVHLPRKLTISVEDALKGKSEPKNGSVFWSWLKDNGTSLITILTILSAIIGAIWTLNEYIEQQRQTEVARQQEVIARFAGELANPEKRNSAVYALAVLADDEVVPLLIYQLQEEALKSSDPAYLNALTQALVTIGEPAIGPVINLNRQTVNQKVSENTEKITTATSPIISYFITQNTNKFLDDPMLLQGVLLIDTNISGGNFAGINLTNFDIYQSLICVTNFENAKLSRVSMNSSFLGASIFTNGVLTDVWFNGSNLVLSDFQSAIVQRPFLVGANLSQSKWNGSNIYGGVFQGAQMELAYFQQAVIEKTDFSSAKLSNAKFDLTKFIGSTFYGADLSHASFRKADLTGVKFFFDQIPDEKPNFGIVIGQKGSETSGAFVRDADFEGATNLNEEMRKYLCRWGAKNVPGGCSDIKLEDLSYIPENEFVPASAEKCTAGND